MKKILAIVLTFALVFSTFTGAFAADVTAISADAKACADLGMLLGSGAGVTPDYTATNPTRIQAAIMFLRLKGLEADAKAFTGTANFADAGKEAWAAPVMAYLKAHPELGWVGDGTNFNPSGLLTVADYYKVMLETLGYKQNTASVIGDFVYGDLAFAATKGLVKVATVTAFTVNDMAIATVEALKATVKGGTKTLAMTMVEAGKLDLAKATAAGVYAAPVVTLAVDSVTSTNLKQIVVTFNKAVNADTDETYFTVDGSGSPDVTSVTLSADSKTVTLKVSPAMVNDDDYDVTISGLLDTSDVEMAEVTKTVTASDESLPTVKTVEFTGPQTAKITFSEPIDGVASVLNAATVSVDDGVYMGDVDNATFGTSSVTVDLGTELTVGDHVFKIKGFEDYVPYQMVAKTMTVSYAAVTTAPVATIKESSQSEVTLTFNRPVNGVELSAFYHSYSSYAPIRVEDSDGVTIDGKYVDEFDVLQTVASDGSEFYDEVTLVFVDDAVVDADAGNPDAAKNRPLPVGKVKIEVLSESDNYNLADRWENELADDVALYVDIKADEVAPTVTKIVVKSETEVRVYFSENMNVSDATDEDNYTITNPDGDVIPSWQYTATYNTDDDYAKLVFDDAQDTGKYTIKIAGLTDESLEANKIAAVTKTFDVTDATPVDMAKVHAYWDGVHVVYVDYGTKMVTTGLYSVLNPDNYVINLDSDTEAGPVEIDSSARLSMFNSNIVKFTFPSDVELTLGDPLTIGRVADLAGNKTVALGTDKVLETIDPVTVTEITKVATNKLELKMSGELKSVAASGITIALAGDLDPLLVQYVIQAANVTIVNDGDDTVIKVTLNANHKSTGTDGLAAGDKINIIGANIKSIFGVEMDDISYTVGGIEPTDGFVDGTAPKLAADENTDEDDVVFAVDADANGAIDHIAIKYSEDINPNTVSKSTYKVAGYTVTSAATLDATDFDSVLTLVDGDASYTGDSVASQWVLIRIDEELSTADLLAGKTDLRATPAVTQQSDVEDMFDNTFKSSTMETISWNALQ